MGKIFSDGQTIVAFYNAINALIILSLAIVTVQTRISKKIGVGDGGDPKMAGPMRAHGNAVEYVPISLLLMLGLVNIGAAAPLIHVMGAGLTLSRISHAAGMLKSTGRTPERAAGVLLGWAVLAVGAIACLFLSITS